MVKLFDLQNGKVIPTTHCYTLETLRAVQEDYPQDFLEIYAYIFYMTCPDPDQNPFFDVPEVDKEELILREVSGAFSPEDRTVMKALEFCKHLYQTPTYRAFMGIKSMLDRLATYMEKTDIVHGRDGNINSLVNAAAKFEQIRASYKGAFKDLMEEQSTSVRGKQQLGYDQK